ncbi:MAG: VOC family protein [Pseudomonadales bacterium]|nr:VOC family protein [Pseudomonadales bacterium]
MSVLFGPVVQQGYVVPDVDAAIQHWLARGIGPFFLQDIRGFSGSYDGKHIDADMRAGFAYCGDQQIEVITPEGSHPSIYKDYLAGNPEGGLQHLAYWVDDVDEALAGIEAKGCRHKVWQRYGEAPDYKAHAYIDIEDQPGVMIQLMARSDFYDMFFGLMKKAADEWDGVTDPIRMLDMSSGAPKAVPYERRV